MEELVYSWFNQEDTVAGTKQVLHVSNHEGLVHLKHFLLKGLFNVIPRKGWANQGRFFQPLREE